jgi:hypothetical protein
MAVERRRLVVVNVSLLAIFCHFLDIETGRRVWQLELSPVDSAFLFAGMLTAAAYFDRDTADEAEVRRLAAPTVRVS